MEKKKKWIKAAVGKNKGLLHKHLGVKEGEKIPADKLMKAAHSKDATVRKEATLAMTLKGFHKKSGHKTHKSASTMIGSMYHKKKG